MRFVKELTGECRRATAGRADWRHSDAEQRQRDRASAYGRMRKLAIQTIYMTGYDVPGAVHQEATSPLLRKPLADDELLATVATQLNATA